MGSKVSKTPKTSSNYQPLPIPQAVLASLRKTLPPQEFNEHEKALNLYSSRSDTIKFTNEEATKVFSALANVGKASVSETKDYTEAFRFISHALMFGKQIQQINNPSFAILYYEMGDLYSDKQKVDEALGCLQIALTIFDSLQLDSEQKFEKCRCILLKAGLLRGNDDLDGACQTLVPCIEIIEGLPLLDGVGEVGTAAFEMMVNMHYHRNDQEKAHEYSKRGLAFMDKVLGEDSFEGNNLARELACTLFEQDRFAEAFVYVRKWHNMLKKVYAQDEPPMVACYFLYGQICSYVGNYAEAIKKFEKAEKVSKKYKNVKFADGGEVFIYKARCHFNLEHFQEAKESFDKAVQYNTKTYGSPSKRLADCLFTGAGILEGSKSFHGEAKDLYFKSLEMYKVMGPACLFETMSTLSSIGFFLHRNEEYKEAVKYAGESLQICQQYFPGHLPRLEGCHNGLGMAQFRSGDLQSGVVNLQIAAKVCEDLKDSSGNLISHYFNLVQIYSETKQYDKVEMYGKKVLEMDFAKSGKAGTWIKDTLGYLETALSNLKKDEEFKKLQSIYT